MSRRQLIAGGVGEEAIRHRVATGRLFELYPGVYAVGVPDRDRSAASSLLCSRAGRERC